jgi:hypothetical protein
LISFPNLQTSLAQWINHLALKNPEVSLWRNSETPYNYMQVIVQLTNTCQMLFRITLYHNHRLFINATTTTWSYSIKWHTRLTTLINWKQVTVRLLAPSWSYVQLSHLRLTFKCSVTAVSIQVFSSNLVTITLIVISLNNCTKAPKRTNFFLYPSEQSNKKKTNHMTKLQADCINKMNQHRPYSDTTIIISVSGLLYKFCICISTLKLCTKQTKPSQSLTTQSIITLIRCKAQSLWHAIQFK